MNDKNLVYMIIIVILSIIAIVLVVSASGILNNTEAKNINSTDPVTFNNSSNDVPDKKTKNKYWCSQCNEYHSKPVDEYHKYGTCPICGKYVLTDGSHYHDNYGYNLNYYALNYYDYNYYDYSDYDNYDDYDYDDYNSYDDYDSDYDSYAYSDQYEY